MNNQKFPSRAGTVGLGDSYEFLMAAYYGLHLSLNENVTDFKLSTNNNDMGNFDDIVLEITYSDGDEFLYALQLKHCASKDESISLMSFDGDKGKFGLTKYCKGFKSIEEVCSDNPSYTLPFDKFYFILYTNQVLPKFTKNERGKKIEIDELPLTKKSDITIYRHDKCVARNLLSLSDSNSHFIYKFKTDKQDLLDEKFLDHFFLYTGQKEVKDVEYEISRFIRSIFSNCDGDVVTNYLNFFKAWWRGDFGNYKLTKRDIMLKLAEYVLIQHIPEVNFKKLPHYGKKSQLLDDCFKNFDLTVVETVENNEIVDSIWGMVLKRYFKNIEKSWLWSQPLPKVETKFLPEDQKVPISAQGENFIDQSLKKIYTILWHMDILPLVIQVSESHKKGIYAAIKLCEDFEQKKKFIVIDRQFAEDEFNEDLKIFKKLSDVVEFEKFDEIKKEFMVSLQGRQGVTLERLIQLDSRFLEIISTKEFLQMLGDNFCIGDDCKKSLPRHYVTRQTPKILLKTEAIDEIQSDLFVVSCQEFQKPNLKSTTFDMHKYLLMKGGNKQFPDKFVVLVNGLCSEKQFKEISSLNNNRNCHHVRIVNNGTIEWIESQGNISQLRAYMIDVLNFQDDHFVNDLEVLDYFNNRINVINAGPGMGKSIMMKFLKYKCPPNHWVIMINLNDHVKFFKEEHTVNEAVEYLLATESKNLFVKQVVQIFSSRMRILFLWDGFDELPGACVNPVVSLMKKLSVEGYWQWIAARNNSRQFLEDTFNLLSLTMTQFSEQDQQVYIHNHIKERYDDEEKVKRMVLQLNENMSSSLSCGYFDYTGVPLQINMVMEIFLKNPQKYLEEIKIVTLTDIYQEFTDGKFTNLFERASAKSKNYLMQKIQMKFKGAQLPQYEIAALKASFDDKIFNSLNLDCDKFLQEIVQSRDSVGLIFGLNDENKPVFTHKTYEEFLTASWLAKNYKDHPDLVQIIFNEEHNNIRLMFDMILAKDSPVHISILYRNMNILETYGNDVSKYKDKGGRNPLQIACAWGSKHPLGTTFRSNTGETVISINENISEPQLNVEVVNFLLSHGCNPFDKDVLIGWDAVEYADKTLSLSLLEAILAFKHEIDFAKLSNFNDVNTLLYYSVKYNYQNLFFRLSDYPYLELSLEGEDTRTLLQFAVQMDRLDFVKLLLNLPHYQNAINKPYKDLGSPLFSAGSNGNIEMFKFLQAKGAQIDRNQSSPLLVAVALGHKAFCRLLLEEKMDVNETFMDGNSVLQIAAMKDHLDVLELLLDYGASVNYVSCLDLTALDYCIDNGCLRGAEILVAKGANVNRQGRTLYGYSPLHNACELGHAEMVKFLLRSGADPTIKSNQLYTPLHVALINKQEEIAKILIEADCSVINEYSEEKSTPLMLAALENFHSTVEMLSQLGADMDSRESKDSPLRIATLKQFDKCVSILLTFGATVNRADIHGNSPLFYAIQNEAIMNLFLDNAATDVNFKGKGFMTPLHFAAENGKIRAVEQLIAHRADVDAVDVNHRTPLHYAARQKHDVIVKCLLKHNASVGDGISLLYLACITDSPDCLLTLLNHGIDVNMSDQEGTSALHFAAMKSLFCVKVLLKKGAVVNVTGKNGLTPLSFAVFLGKIDIVKELVENGADLQLGFDRSTALHVSARLGDIATLILLINLGSDVNAQDEDGRTALHCISEQSDDPLLFKILKTVKSCKIGFQLERSFEDCANELIERGTLVTKASKSGWTPIVAAAFHNNLDMVKFFQKKLQSRRDLDDEWQKSFLAAALKNHEAVLQFLHESGLAKVNGAGGTGRMTALHCACSEGSFQCALYLIKNGVNVDATNTDGCTPLYFCARRGHLDLVRLLLENKAEVNAPNGHGNTSVFAAAAQGLLEVVTLLHENGADINVIDDDGDTPLHDAAAGGHLQVVQFLLSKGADVGLRNKNGKVPADLAINNERDDVAHFFQSNT